VIVLRSVENRVGLGDVEQLEPPAGLSDEWQHVYRVLAQQVLVATAFYSHTDSHLLPLEALTAWRDGLRRVRGWAQKVMPYLHGRAPRTWDAGHTIDRAIFPIDASLGSVVSFRTNRLPLSLSPEAQAAPSRARLGELRGFDGQTLLSELAHAVTSECGVRLGLSDHEDRIETAEVAASSNTTQRTRGKARRPGNPANRWNKKEKAEARRFLAAWKKARVGKTMEQFLGDYSLDKRVAIRSKIKTAMKWESEAKRKSQDWR
jgi:hypothetical protein